MLLLLLLLLLLLHGVNPAAHSRELPSLTTTHVSSKLQAESGLKKPTTHETTTKPKATPIATATAATWSP
jgi:hypothetical protein